MSGCGCGVRGRALWGVVGVGVGPEKESLQT